MFNNFADRLYILRRLRNVNVSECARMVDVTPTAVSSWENNRSFPHGKVLLKLTQQLNCSLPWLMGEAPIDSIEGAEER